MAGYDSYVEQKEQFKKQLKELLTEEEVKQAFFAEVLDKIPFTERMIVKQAFSKNQIDFYDAFAESLYQFPELQEKYLKPAKEINVLVDLSDISDSMLLNSGTLIADYTDFENDIYMTLEVRGEVNVEYKGETYREPSEFPEELKDLIKTNNWWDVENKEIYVDANNWFELFVWEDKDFSKFISSDVVDVENQSLNDLKIFMNACAEEILQDRMKEDVERDI